MTRADLARIAVRAYPAGSCPTDDAEIISTLLDAGDTSGAAFLRELSSVTRCGVAQRMAQAQRIRPFPLLVNALIYGGLTLCAWMAGHMSYVAAPTTGARLFLTGLLLSVLTYGLGVGRAAGAIGIASLAALRLAGSFSQIDDIWAGCQLMSFLAMVLRPSIQRNWPQRLGGLTLAGAALLAADQFGGWPTGWYLMAAVGLAAVPINPALTLGMGGMLAATGALQMLYLPLSASVMLPGLAAPIALALVIAAQRAALRTGAPLH